MDSTTRAGLKQLLESQHWGDIYHFVALMTDKWHNAEYKSEDQFNTMWNMALKEGKIQGVREFFDSLEREILDKE